MTADIIVGQFERHGFAVVRGVLDPNVRTGLRDVAECLLASDQVIGRDRGADGKDGFRGCISLDRRFLTLAADPRMVALMTKLLSPNVHLLSAQLIALPSPSAAERTIRVPGRHGWHRDMHGVSDDLGYNRTPRMGIKCAYYLTEPSVRTGTTMVLPGSHRFVSSDVVEIGDIDPPGAVTPDVGPLDALIFENRTWHAGGINSSGRPRIAVIYQYGYRWLAPVDDPPTVPGDATPLERQLLGQRDRRADGSYTEGVGAAPLRELVATLETPTTPAGDVRT